MAAGSRALWLVVVMAPTSNGTVFARCACRSVETGKQWGARCPQRGLVGHGRWYVDAHVPGPDGRQKRLRRGGFLSRAAAEEGLAEVLELPGPAAMAETWTLKRWLEYWLSRLGDRLRPSTVRAYRSVTRAHLIPWLGRFRLADLDGRRGVKTVQRAVDAPPAGHYGNRRAVAGASRPARRAGTR